MKRALVMGGGGPVGLAWETGVAAGLAEAGVELRMADLLLGTSAGASVCAQIALGRDLTAVVKRYRAKDPTLVNGKADPPDMTISTGAAVAAPIQWGATGPMARVAEIISAALNDGLSPEQARAALGKYALEAKPMDEETFVNHFRHLRGETWPSTFACTAVDAQTGAFTVWNAENPAELERAVASSSAVPGVFPPVTIGGRPYIDAGGGRSGTSADVAAGHDLVLLFTLRDPAVSTDGSPELERSRQRIVNECKAIEDAGGTVAMFMPDAPSLAAMGSNPHDRAAVPAAAVEGVRQGRVEADRVAAIWR